MKKSLLFLLMFMTTLVGARADIKQDDQGWYLVTNYDDLMEICMIARSGTYNFNVKLMADIDLSESTDNFFSIGTFADSGGSQNYFAGTFDGQGHVIKNMRIVRSDNYEVGFFSRCSGATIKNLGIINAYCESKNGIRAGIMFGECYNSRVENCFTAGELTVVTTHATNFGGFAGEAAGTTSFYNCYTTYDNAVGVIGSENNYHNTFWGEAATSIAATGELCYTLNGDQSDIHYYQTLGEDAYPVSDSTHKKVYAAGQLNCDGSPLGEVTYSNDDNGTVLKPHEYGADGYCVNCGKEDGEVKITEDGWYEVTRGEELRWVARNIVNAGTSGAKIRLMNDIDLSGLGDLPPLGTYNDNGTQTGYQGTFDGQNHIIYNLTVNVSSGEEAGLFGRINGDGSVKNLGIVNASITNGAAIRAGVLAGEIHACTITNVFTAGDIFISTDHSQKGGISGEAASSTFNNCYTTYDVMTNAASALNNCYWGTEAQDGAESGALCYKMNGNSIQDVTWYQNIGEDMYPVLDSTHGLVYPSGEEEYASASTPEQYAALVNMLIENEKATYTDYVCSQKMLNNYLKALDALNGKSFDDFLTGYASLNGLREAVLNSVEAYKAYDAKVAEVKAYLESHNDFEGTDRDLLNEYLTANVEPGDKFPNGSYAYIYGNLQLSVNELSAECDYVQQLLDNAIKTGYKAGAEITNLLTNATFADGTKGWTYNKGQVNGTSATSADVKYVQYSAVSMDMSQTIDVAHNGIYEVRIGGYTEVNDVTPIGAYNYGGFVYANEYSNYMETQRSNLAPAEIAEKYEGNFDLKYDANDEEAGYAPCSVTGVAQAISEGYYQNTILVNVTDGKLTIGLNNKGTVGRTNSTYYADVHLYYLGTVDDANYTLDEVLENMVVKANHILKDYVYDEGMYDEAPNFYQGLKDQLAAAVEAYTSATEPQAKYDLIGTFSKLFQEIYENKAAYIALLQGAEDLYDAYYAMNASQEDLTAIEERYGEYADMHSAGSANTDEIMAIVNQMTSDKYYLQRYGIEPEQDENGIYQLATPYNLVWFAAQVNAGNQSIKGALTNDIDMTEITNFTPIGLHRDDDIVYNFQGTFDGQGHVIKNLTVSREDGTEAGLFSRTESAVIKNLGIVNANITNLAEVRAGVLAGEIVSSTIRNCYVVGDINITTDHVQTGAIAGEIASSSTLTNCYTTYSQLTNINSGSLINCYEGEEIASMLSTGELCYKLNGTQDEIVYYQTLGQDAYPILDSTHGTVYAVGELNCGGDFVGDYSLSNEPNTNPRPDHQLGEDGICSVCGYDAGEFAPTDDGWYEVTNCYQLRYLSSMVQKGDGNIKVRLMNDIDMSPISNFQPLGMCADEQWGLTYVTFKGTFDGQGHALHNLTVTRDDPYEVGFIGRADGGATIKNLGIINATMTSNNPGGGIRVGVIGGELNACTVENCWSTGELVLTTTHTQKGGIAGEFASSTVSGCWTTYKSVGAVGTKKNCFSHDDVEAMHASGELCYKLNDGNVVNPAWRQNLGEDEYPVLDDSHKIVYFENDTYTNGASELASHAGTKDDPFPIASVKDMTDIHKYLIPGQLNYIVLEKDLDMSEVTDWVPMNLYDNAVGDLHYMNWVDFDGQGHVIKNFQAKSATQDYESFFGILCGACRNVGFEDCDVECTSTGSGILASWVGHTNYTETTAIDHVYVTGKLSVAANQAGGFFGNVAGPTYIVNSYANVDITSQATYTGGLIGRVSAALNVQNCYVAGSFSSGNGVVGGGQDANTPASIYNNIVVWNNVYESFGGTAADDTKTNISYYDGDNFAALQQTVVAWDPTIWSVEGNNYPILVGTSTGVRTIAQDDENVTVYNLTGMKVKSGVSRAAALKSLPKGVYLINGRKYLNK